MTQPAHAPIPGSDPSYFRFETWQIAVIIAGMLLWPVEFAVIHTPFTFLAALAVAIFYDWRGVKNLRGFVHWDRLTQQTVLRWLLIAGFVVIYPLAFYVYTWRAVRHSSFGEWAFAWSRQSSAHTAIGIGALVVLLIPTCIGFAVIGASPATNTTLASATATPHTQGGSQKGKATATPKPTKIPATATPTPRPPTNTPTPKYPAVGGNPYDYNFTCCKLIYNPPADLCDYLMTCISSFGNSAGYVVECKDGDYATSGGLRGSCSKHNGEWRPLLAP